MPVSVAAISARCVLAAGVSPASDAGYATSRSRRIVVARATVPLRS